MIVVFGSVVLSEVDGPGVRAVVHFAGCTVGCPGCFNRAMWASTGPCVRQVDPDALATEILALSKDVTISGGEPTEQLEGLIDLLVALRDQDAESVILFTGRVIEPGLLAAFRVLDLVDVVIDGGYDARRPEDEWMRGSANQEIHVLSNRIARESLRTRGVQIQLDGDQIVVTGFPTRKLLRELGDKYGR